ncbi:hypothetical protein AM587_10001817 [Phytophthora nicotianae]|uniref:Uncharacterized protein n=1 Tax=Phytophthora nicotianae TaxID=4792 RepID=A0A0W8CC84_PHYNI|nr:hypothetical protein AM587_10001817 [Phytophthora nicotianae]
MDQCSDDSLSRSSNEQPVDRTLPQQHRPSTDAASTEADDILLHWCDFFCEMDGNPPPSSEDFDMHEGEEEELDVQPDVSQLRLVPIPEDNDPHFPQESRKLPELRGRKMPLV